MLRALPAVLAHVVTEPELFAAMALDATLEPDPDEGRLVAALAYEAAPDSRHHCWIPARRRPTSQAAFVRDTANVYRSWTAHLGRRP